jgi:small subunit ribosomal protein S9
LTESEIPPEDERTPEASEPRSSEESEAEVSSEAPTPSASEDTSATDAPSVAPAEPSADQPVLADPEEPVAAASETLAEQPGEPGPPAEEIIAEAAPAAEAAAEPAEGDEDEEEVAPRVKPAIPGADLIPDIVSDGDDFLDAEARAAAEAEAEEAARRASEADSEEESRPIADAAIDLAAGARYTSTGKRKTAVARVILKPGTGTYSINGRTLEEFFPRDTLQRMIRQPLETVGYESRMDVVALMHGGGVAAQAGALRHGVSRALIVADPNLRGELKRRGFLTRDPRVKERKKAGLKKARKRPQFSKR